MCGLSKNPDITNGVHLLVCLLAFIKKVFIFLFIISAKEILVKEKEVESTKEILKNNKDSNSHKEREREREREKERKEERERENRERDREREQREKELVSRFFSFFFSGKKADGPRTGGR